VPPPEAEAIVWATDEPRLLAATLHPGVRWVQLCAAGVDLWLDAGVMDPSVAWTAAKGVHARPIAEYTVGMMIAAARDFAARVGARSRGGRGDRLVSGSTVGIVGAGGIGRCLLELLRPFDVRSIALTRTGHAVPGATLTRGPGGLDELLAASDWVVLAAPATPSTRSLISAAGLARMRSSAWLINVSRGSLVDTGALVAALRSGELRGAILDVTEPEPLPDGHVLWSLPNAIITPHVASTPELAATALSRRIQENVSRYAAGRELIGVVDLAAGY
jgi:phosphoglycerate dehydrogenase-like enzyme